MSLPSYKCPRCNGTHFKKWALPHPYILHWVLNPGLAFNELILGQRVTKTQLVCLACDGPLIDRAYVPCPSCGTMHLGRRASGRRGFGNWRGIACPTCHEPIPCLWNVFSWLILLLTSPLWFIPYHLYFRKQPLKLLFPPADGSPPPLKPLKFKNFILLGLLWGGLMWLCLTFLPVLVLPAGLSDEFRESTKLQVDQFILFMAGGCTTGCLLWLMLCRQSKKKSLNESAVSRIDHD